jgi:hypothetical protein
MTTTKKTRPRNLLLRAVAAAGTGAVVAGCSSEMQALGVYPEDASFAQDGTDGRPAGLYDGPGRDLGLGDEMYSPSDGPLGVADASTDGQDDVTDSLPEAVGQADAPTDVQTDGTASSDATEEA